MQYAPGFTSTGGVLSSIILTVHKAGSKLYLLPMEVACRSGETGRRKGLKIPRANNPYRFEPGLRHHILKWAVMAHFCYYFVDVVRAAKINIVQGRQYDRVIIGNRKLLTTATGTIYYHYDAFTY
jgi:hypothetical protein